MWQWQQHFRVSAQVLADMSLKKIGARLAPLMSITAARQSPFDKNPLPGERPT
jgi:hypothetical protein